MKFGLHLNQGMVPEWRDQYLDYSLGKKLLKKIVDHNPIPHTVDAAPLPGKQNIRTFLPKDEPLILPPPALQEENVSDQSPLLDSSGSQSYGGQHNGDDQLNKLKSSSKGKPGESSNWIARTIRSSFTAPYMSSENLPLDSMMETAERDFLVWVDDEVDKLNAFFKEREKEAVERYLLLQDQLIRMSEQREAVRREHAANAGIKKAANSTKFLLIKEIEVPTLPLLLQNYTKWKGKQHATNFYHNNTTDFERRIYTTPYPIAKRQLKLALSEYYHSLELLKGYRALNTTAIRKIVKKFDKTTGKTFTAAYLKKVKNTNLVQSDILDSLLARTEDLFAYYFENGNHKIAVEKLRAREIPEEHYAAMFITGLLLGLTIPFAIDAIVVGLDQVKNSIKSQDYDYLFQIWGGFFLVNLFLCLFTVNLMVWSAFRINYSFVFEFDPRNHLDYRQYGVLPSASIFLMSVCAWFTFHDFWPDSFPGRYFPIIYLAIVMALFLWPFKVFYWRSRKWLILALLRLFLSGFYPVEFRDFFLGDIFCSLNYSLSNLSFFFCLYAKRWGYFGGVYDPAEASVCSSSHSRLLGYLNAQPGIWRFIQCLRRYADTGDSFPHLANAAKYSCLILYYMFLSLARIDHSSQTWHSLLITFACLNAVYSSFWDLFMDFSLMQPNAKYKWLRNELAFESPLPYYAMMIADPILRFNWIFYAIYWSQIQQSAKVSFFVSLAEILRRFLWVFFRVENEHCSNVVKYRASRDLTLPYPEIKKRETPINTPRLGSIIDPKQSRDETPQSISQSTHVTSSNQGPIAFSSGADNSQRVESAIQTRRSPSDEEAVAGMPNQETPKTPGTQSSSSSYLTPARRLAAYATPVLLAVSTAVKSAHTEDFQRRIPKTDQDEADSDSDQE